MKYVGLMTQRNSGREDVKIILKNIMYIFPPLVMVKRNPQIIVYQRIPRMMKEEEEEGKEFKKKKKKKREERTRRKDNILIFLKLKKH